MANNLQKAQTTASVLAIAGIVVAAPFAVEQVKDQANAQIAFAEIGRLETFKLEDCKDPALEGTYTNSFAGLGHPDVQLADEEIMKKLGIAQGFDLAETLAIRRNGVTCDKISAVYLNSGLGS